MCRAIATSHHGDYDPSRLVDAKGAGANGPAQVSLCLPARNEAATVGPIVDAIRAGLVDRHGLVDEILVIDDHSTDHTAVEAASAGAKVVQAAEILPEYGEGHGKGEALWKSLFVSSGDLIVWCDSDIVDFDPRFVVGLLGPLLTRPEVGFVKGFYARPPAPGPDLRTLPGDRGGRVTELVARPLLSLLFPDLSEVIQPLAGEYGGRRSLLEQLPFVRGYGVDIGLLIDVAARFGKEVIAQVDLGRRIHRNRTLDELSPQATAIVQTVLRRAGHDLPNPATLLRPGLEPLAVDTTERPPLVDVAAYRMRS